LPIAFAPGCKRLCHPCRRPVAALLSRLGLPPNRGRRPPRYAGLLGLHLALCGFSSLLDRLAMYCRRAPASRPGPPLRCGWLRLGLARGRIADAEAGGPGGWRGTGRWRAGHRPGCHPQHARDLLRAPAGRPPRSGRQRRQEGVPGGPRCWRTSGAGTARAGGQEAHARS
jgi:hypothetical protein